MRLNNAFFVSRIFVQTRFLHQCGHYYSTAVLAKNSKPERPRNEYNVMP